MGKPLLTIPSGFDPYRPYMKHEGRIIQMGRGQDSMWASVAPANDKASTKITWNNGDEHSVVRVQEVLQDGKPRCMTEIENAAGMSRVCATRILRLMVRQGVLEHTRERGAMRYWLKQLPEAA